MITIVILVGVAALVASAPTENKKTIINVEGTDGHHIQTGEPGKAVSGYFTSRNSKGVEEKTTYVADENGFRATGDHLPISSFVYPVPSAFPSVYPSYGYRYGPQNYYPFYYPNVPGGKMVSSQDYLPELNDNTELTDAEIAALTERGPLTPFFLPMILMNKKAILMMLLKNKLMMMMG